MLKETIALTTALECAEGRHEDRVESIRRHNALFVAEVCSNERRYALEHLAKKLRVAVERVGAKPLSEKLADDMAEFSAVREQVERTFGRFIEPDGRSEPGLGRSMQLTFLVGSALEQEPQGPKVVQGREVPPPASPE